MFSCLFLSLSVVSRSWALVAPSSPSWSSGDVRSTSASVSRSFTAAGGELAPFVLDFDVKRSVSGIPAIDRDDVVYLANVTVSGQPFLVQLDTGSADFWIHKREGVQVSKQTEKRVKVEYGTGWVSGNVAFAPFTVGNFQVPSQAFINVDASAELDDLDGIWGLGFDRASNIHSASMSTSSIASRSPDSSTLTPLTNIFAQTPMTSNVLTLDLSRSVSGDASSSSSGTFTIGPYMPAARFEGVPHVPVAETSGGWEVALDGMRVDGQPFDLSRSMSALATAVKKRWRWDKRQGQKGQNINVLLDSGTSFALVDDAAADFIYGGMQGAKSCVIDGGKFWFVPCLSTANVSFGFGGRFFSVHPLDLTLVMDAEGPDGEPRTVCAGVFTGKSSAPDIRDEPLWVLGDAFMRNVLTAFHFGRETLEGGFDGAPTVQMASKTDQAAAATEFRHARWEALRGRPKMMDPVDVNCANVPHP